MFKGFLIGVGAGAIVMLLYAPKSGKDTRRRLSRTIHDSKRFIERSATTVYGIGEDIGDKSKGFLKQANRAVNATVKAGSSVAAAIM